MTDYEKREVQHMIDNSLRGNFSKKIGDTPNDGLQYVTRRYLTQNGSIASRPRNPVVGQMYLATTPGYPVWWNGNNWVSATGSVVAGAL